MAQHNPSHQSKNTAHFSQMGFNSGRGPRPGEIQHVRSKNAKGTLLRIWDYLKLQRRGLFIVVISTALISCLMLLGPYLIGKTIDNYIVPHHFHGLIRMGFILFGVYFLGALFTWIQQYVASSLSQNTVRDMRQDLFDKYQALPIRFFDQKTHGELMSRATNDIANVSNTLNQTVVQLISSLFILVGSVVMMLSLSLWMTLITILTVPTVALITKKVTKYTRQYFSEQQRHLGEVNGFVQENISGLRVIKTFGREAQSIEEFKEINEKLRLVGIKAQSLSGSMGPMMNTMRNLSFVVISVCGGVFAYHDLITIGIIVSFLNYSNQFSQPINQLANQYNLLQSAIAGAERVFEVLDQASETLEENKGVSLKEVKGEVIFDRVNFGYESDVPVLKNLSLHASPGQMIALVGPTGAGKTTIINLLSRFYDIQSGQIFIDGKDIYTLDKHFLRQQIGLVLQDAYVFSGTIRENIRYGRLAATDREVEEAARLANADAFISRLPNGYETQLNAEGSNLSQGQRQLLTIARAVLANPAILILDEATSSVDTRTELHIQEAMKTLMKGRTSFVIAHRLSTIQDADHILVINNGEVVEQGSHEALLLQGGFYATLYKHQLTQGNVS
ncbi:ATP-binding cassette subfamily B protein [Pullulanibacillus pueri]|uniref:Multidrug ABC transporter ATP-binding protein n=1 Tax=Pullulanibacillus pueri TaxID=1437324 RepID=A0A8J2ZTM9_9BACL|nr:ABC transporter ATP-binding protein [Pullulanibacillus pueri]MBM7681229.1 ATP-binding cassette subfamily B protein [Pullulanibacillus pueri]GGH77955.1 multidrug ABC transporter ATP-binding protein [Pullulanibacillus pueri]